MMWGVCLVYEIFNIVKQMLWKLGNPVLVYFSLSGQCTLGFLGSATGVILNDIFAIVD